MKPLRLRARNLRTFPEIDLPLDEGLIGILGELRDAPEGASSNGSGKSTILEAIDIALFGRRSLAGYLTRGGDVDELMIELTFEHGVLDYRVRRTYPAKGRGKTSVDLEVSHDTPHHSGDDHGPGWEPLTRASARETDQLICDIIGLSQTTFRDSSYLRQGDGGYADPDRDPKQRKELLVEAVLGRDPVWPRLADTARARRKATETQLERHRGETERLTETAGFEEQARASLNAAEESVVTAQNAVSQAEKAHQAATLRWQGAREQAATRATLVAELTAARTERDRLNSLELAATEAATATQAVREEIDTLATAGQTAELEERQRELVTVIDEYRTAAAAYETAQRERATAIARRDELVGRAAEARANATTLRGQADAALAHIGDAECDRCGQVLGKDAAHRAAASYRDDADRAEAQARLLDDEALIEIPALGDAPERPGAAEGALVAVRASLEKARADAAQRARLEERLVQLEKAVEARPTIDALTSAGAQVQAREKALDELEPVDLDTLDRELSAAGLAMSQARAGHTAAVTERTRWEERLTTVTAAKDRLVEIQSATGDLQTQIDRDLLLEKAYGRDGIPALIIENTAIPSIEAEASRILRALGTAFDVQLRTQQETKAGTLRDTLEVVVIDQDGNEADYADGCSGGEQTRIGLALRIALARLLAHRRGAESRLLALDEPSYLDAAGMTALLDVLRGLDSEFDLILLVSHVAELRDALEDVIVVRKEGGLSTIESQDREAVEA